MAFKLKIRHAFIVVIYPALTGVDSGAYFVRPPFSYFWIVPTASQIGAHFPNPDSNRNIRIRNRIYSFREINRQKAAVYLNS